MSANDNVLFTPTTPPLRLAPPLADPSERNRVIEILHGAASSAKGLIARGVRYLSRFGWLSRASGWLSQARLWLRPATTVIIRSGAALPLWLATTPLIQRITVAVACRAGRTLRAVLLAATRVAERMLSLAGQWGKRQAARLSRAVESADNAMAKLASTVCGWATRLAASWSQIRVLRDVSFVVVIARQLRALVPPPWRLAVTALSLLSLGEHTRRWISTAFAVTKALLRDLTGLLAPARPVAAAAGDTTVAIRPVTPPRPNQPRRHHR